MLKWEKPRKQDKKKRFINQQIAYNVTSKIIKDKIYSVVHIIIHTTSINWMTTEHCLRKVSKIKANRINLSLKVSRKNIANYILNWKKLCIESVEAFWVSVLSFWCVNSSVYKAKVLCNDSLTESPRNYRLALC